MDDEWAESYVCEQLVRSFQDHNHICCIHKDLAMVLQQRRRMR
jgi:hypothetical protein